MNAFNTVMTSCTFCYLGNLTEHPSYLQPVNGRWWYSSSSLAQCVITHTTYTYMYYTQRPEGNFACYQNDPWCSGTAINFEVLTEVSLKVQVFWDVTLCCWVSSSDVLSKGNAFTFRIKTLQNMGTTCPDTTSIGFSNRNPETTARLSFLKQNFCDWFLSLLE